MLKNSPNPAIGGFHTNANGPSNVHQETNQTRCKIVPERESTDCMEGSGVGQVEALLEAQSLADKTTAPDWVQEDVRTQATRCNNYIGFHRIVFSLGS